MPNVGEILQAKHSEESGHWYRKDGTPAYEVIGKNGKARNTTLRDARKEGLVPSVTMINNLANKPVLTEWKIDQNIMSARTIPYIEGESDKDLIARIKADANEQARKAREKGTLIHAWVQDYYTDVQLPGDAEPYCHAAQAELEDLKGDTNWICEMSFACDSYGGKCDLHTSDYIIDIKTTDKPLADIKTWDEHTQQLAAYRHGLGYPKALCGILYINTIDASARLMMLDETELVRGHNMFMALKDYFYAKTMLAKQ